MRVALKQLKVWNRVVQYEWWAVVTAAELTMRNPNCRRMGAWLSYRRSRTQPTTTQIAKTVLLFCLRSQSRAAWIWLRPKSAQLTRFLPALNCPLTAWTICRILRLFRTTRRRQHRQHQAREDRLHAGDQEDVNWAFKIAMYLVQALQQEVAYACIIDNDLTTRPDRRLADGNVHCAGSATYQIFKKKFLGYRSRTPNPNLKP